ncbi:hypothetical protein ABEB36_014066 [Hypothenemus hampei]|uniref:Tc1-like transposase DDE domain-containing protein n=1 Tax=Hypothenemus hampei TaxID=57062 RepID=A0ABD1E370_HYPHA
MVLSEQHFSCMHVNLLPWPPRSPDLSAIKQVWNMIGRRLASLAVDPQTIDALRREIQTAWNNLPQ